MKTVNYEIKQWQYKDTHDSYPSKYLRYFVVSFDLKPGTAKYLRDDGVWCDVLQCRQFPDGGTFFSTREDARTVLDKYNAAQNTNAASNTEEITDQAHILQE